MILFAPLYRGGYRPIPILLLALLAIMLMLVLLYRPSVTLQRIPPTMLMASSLLILVPLFYLIPIPWEWATRLPGRAFYREIFHLTPEMEKGGVWLQLSLVPARTLTSVFLLLIPVSVFLASLSLRSKQLIKLLYLLFAMAGFQAFLGLLQIGAGHGTWLYLGVDNAGNNSVGTYVNRNHLAGLLYLVTPPILALIFIKHSRSRSSASLKRAFLSINKDVVMLSLLVILLFVCTIFTRSRTGIILYLAGFVLTALFLSRVFAETRIKTVVFAFFSIVILSALMIGLAPTVQRFLLLDPLGNRRIRLFEQTWEGAVSLLPFGAGPGTYVDIFPRFENFVVGVGRYVNHAHNDYLEWFFEAGFFAPLIFIFFLVSFFKHWIKLGCLVRKRPENFIVLQIACGIGVLMLLFHGMVDYNLRIPANAVFFSFLLGIFFNSWQFGVGNSKKTHKPSNV